MTKQKSLIPEDAPKSERRAIPLALLPVDSDLPGPAPTAQFIENVERFGVLENIVVVERPSKSSKAGGFDVIDGRRRVKAARAAGLDRVPAIVYGAQDGKWREVLTLATNTLRSDNPVSELVAIESLMKHGASKAEITDATGLPAGTIEKRLKLAGLIGPIRKELMAGKIAVSTAEALATMASSIQEELYAATEEESVRITMAQVKVFKTAERQHAIEQLPMSVFDGPKERWQDQVVARLREAAKLIPEQEFYPAREIEKLVETISKWESGVDLPPAEWKHVEETLAQPGPEGS
jgi:ParB/RepB/Spo0J family partition protein